MVKPVSIRAIEAATQTTWQDWCAFLGEADATAFDHNAIVKLARSFKPVSGWWAQSIAVAYEQHIGRRLPGQTGDGLFSASVSRTIAGSLQPVHMKWCKFVSDLTTIDGQALIGPPTTSSTPKRLYWRCKFCDRSAVTVGMETKAVNKVLIAVEHKKLTHQSHIDDKKTVWVGLLDTCFKK